MKYSMGDFKGITYSEGDFHTPGQSGYEGISYNPGDYVTSGTSGFGGFVDSSKRFIADNQVALLALFILGIGIYALKEDNVQIKRNPTKKHR